MKKLKLDLKDLKVESFEAVTLRNIKKGTVAANAPLTEGCPPTDGQTCPNTCYNTCANTCANTCGGTCPNNTCANTCPDTCWPETQAECDPDTYATCQDPTYCGSWLCS